MTIAPSGGAAPWDPAQYARYRRERAQPFHDLLARVPAGHRARRIADLGCGDAELTRGLALRWPEAQVQGVDLSEEMLARAATSASALPPNLTLVQQDLRAWSPAESLDLIVSNAALHWIPDHGAEIARLAGLLAPGGILAVQVPNSRKEPAHLLVDALAADARWSGRLAGVSYESFVEGPWFYGSRLRGLGLEADVWETIYHHGMASTRDIAEWLKGTTLRPILAALPAADAGAFVDALTERLAGPYPADAHGVVFPFRRLFFVATKPARP